MRSAPEREELRVRAEITSHFAAGPQARWRGASDEQYPGRYVRSEQQSQRACGPAGARRRRTRIGVVAAPRRCPTAPSSRRLASARPALAPKWEFISARALITAKGFSLCILGMAETAMPRRSVHQVDHCGLFMSILWFSTVVSKTLSDQKGGAPIGTKREQD